MVGNGSRRESLIVDPIGKPGRGGRANRESAADTEPWERDREIVRAQAGGSRARSGGRLIGMAGDDTSRGGGGVVGIGTGEYRSDWRFR
jgi:hypothetical protein